MPGWWFTIESTTTRHFIHQFKFAVEIALRSKPDARAIMRARATKQRFPVQQWVEDLEKLQSSALEISHKQAAKEKRPVFDSPSTPTILEAPSTLRLLQPRAPVSRRPQSEMVQASTKDESLGTITEVHHHSEIWQASDKRKYQNASSERRLLPVSGPGLGSKMGPSSRRKPPPALLLSSANLAARNSAIAVRRKSDDEPEDDLQRPPIPRSPSSPNFREKPFSNERETSDRGNRPEMKRSQTASHPRNSYRRSVQLLGVQISESQANALSFARYSPSSSDEPSYPNSSPRAPATSSTAYYTPPITPTPPPSRTSRVRFSYVTNSTKPSSVSGSQPRSPGNTNSSATSISAANSSSAPILSGAVKSANAAESNDSFTKAGSSPATDAMPSLGSHSGIPVLSTSGVKGEKPDYILQNVVPFFSDPDKKYETEFRKKLKVLNGKTSESNLCIEEFLLQSEKTWFNKLKAAELSKVSEARAPESLRKNAGRTAREDERGQATTNKRPVGLERFLRRKIGDWPIYSFLLAFVSISKPSTASESSCLHKNISRAK